MPTEEPILDGFTITGQPSAVVTSSGATGAMNQAGTGTPAARNNRLERSLSIAKADRKSTRLNSSHGYISYAVFCLKKKKKPNNTEKTTTTTKHWQCWRTLKGFCSIPSITYHCNDAGYKNWADISVPTDSEPLALEN